MYVSSSKYVSMYVVSMYHVCMYASSQSVPEDERWSRTEEIWKDSTLSSANLRFFNLWPQGHIKRKLSPAAY